MSCLNQLEKQDTAVEIPNYFGRKFSLPGFCCQEEKYFIQVCMYPWASKVKFRNEQHWKKLMKAIMLTVTIKQQCICRVNLTVPRLLNLLFLFM